MSSDWKTFKLGDITSWMSGGTPKKDNPKFWGGDIPWISANSMSTIRIESSDLNLTQEGLNNGSRLAPKGAILLLVRGGALHTRVPLGITMRNVAFNQDVKAIIPNPTYVDPWFLLSWFIANRSRLLEMVEYTGIGAGKLDTARLQNLLIDLPTKNEQQRIVRLSKSVDDKIELNRKMNVILEQIAQGIFESWFVNFYPVKAKVAGRVPEGMSEEIAELFPSAFEDSELGPIPKGWQITTLGNLIDVRHGYAFQGEFFRANPPGDVLLTPGNFAIGGGFKSDKFKYYSGPVPEEFVLTPDDLIVTMTDLSKASDTLGYPALVPKVRETRYLHNQRLGKVLVKSPKRISKLHLYYLLRTKAYRDEVLASATGTTVKHTSPSRIKAFRFPFPTNNLSLKFGEIAGAIHKKIHANEEQTFVLDAIRNILLPKLISGQIRFPDFEQAEGGVR